MRSEILKPDFLNSDKWSAFYKKKQLKSGQKCLDFGWSGFQMVGTIAIAKALKTGPFEIRSSKSPDLECSNFRSPLNNGQVPMIGLIRSTFLLFSFQDSIFISAPMIQHNSFPLSFLADNNVKKEDDFSEKYLSGVLIALVKAVGQDKVAEMWKASNLNIESFVKKENIDAFVSSNVSWIWI